jgi:hypothetical protein
VITLTNTCSLAGESHENYQAAYTDGQPNEAKLSHEVLAGGAAFAAFKMFEDAQRKEGMISTLVLSPHTADHPQASRFPTSSPRRPSSAS